MKGDELVFGLIPFYYYFKVTKKVNSSHLHHSTGLYCSDQREGKRARTITETGE